jgi:DNA uptake protein ComE-like DNA-binding protein
MSNGAAPGPSEGSEIQAKNRIIDLNTADETTLAGLSMIGPEKARLLVQHRPYRQWEDVERIPGLGGGTVDILAMAGVQLGDGGDAG